MVASSKEVNVAKLSKRAAYLAGVDPPDLKVHDLDWRLKECKFGLGWIFPNDPGNEYYKWQFN